MLRAVIADVSGIVNIADIADIADIVTDIADVVNIQILRWKQVGAYKVLLRCLSVVCCIRLFLLLLGLVVIISQVTEGRTAAARQAAENCTVAGV